MYLCQIWKIRLENTDKDFEKGSMHNFLEENKVWSFSVVLNILHTQIYFSPWTISRNLKAEDHNLRLDTLQKTDIAVFN